jgi:hypothetical protein
MINSQSDYSLKDGWAQRNKDFGINYPVENTQNHFPKVFKPESGFGTNLGKNRLTIGDDLLI